MRVRLFFHLQHVELGPCSEGDLLLLPGDVKFPFFMSTVLK